MNTIREIQNLNKRELENGVSTEASWHADYRDTAFIYIGGLPFDLSEGDILTIFSQYGEPTYCNLIRDKETGKSKGFAFLKYEDQRSTDLAVDNLGGTTVMGRVLKIDHTRYKRKEGEEEEERERMIGIAAPKAVNEGSEEEQRSMLREEKELAILLRDHDEDDPMKSFLVQEKKEEVTKALAVLGKASKQDGVQRREHRHRHHHSRRKERRSDASENEEAKRKGHKHHHRRPRSP